MRLKCSISTRPEWEEQGAYLGPLAPSGHTHSHPPETASPGEHGAPKNEVHPKPVDFQGQSSTHTPGTPHCASSGPPGSASHHAPVQGPIPEMPWVWVWPLQSPHVQLTLLCPLQPHIAQLLASRILGFAPPLCLSSFSGSQTLQWSLCVLHATSLNPHPHITEGTEQPAGPSNGGTS